MKRIFSLSLLFFLFCPGYIYAHPGGLDRNGGHHDSKTGGYHYHNSPPEHSTGGGYQKPPELYISYPKPEKAKIREIVTTGVEVTGVSDGDTIKVRIKGKEVKIRLYGIDSPESKQQYGRASENAIKQILNGRKIRVENLGYDKYGRMLAIVYADGKSVNEVMVKGGYAWVYDKYCDMDFCGAWKDCQRNAKQLSRALWSDNNPTPPWEWRHKIN